MERILDFCLCIKHLDGGMASSVLITDGTFDFSAGVDSGKVPTVKSDVTLNGLKRNNLAWMCNCTARGGGVTQRTGWKSLCTVVPAGTGLYQGGWLYDNSFQGGDPYLVLSIAGLLYRVRVDTNNAVDVLNVALPNSATQPEAFFCQGEEFLIVQAGDGVSAPLIWDGSTARRGLANEIPAAFAMDYYMGRLWYAKGRVYTAGDIVGGPSGTAGAPYYLRDSILKLTENPLGQLGDGFIVPTQAGNIRAIAHSANLDTALGQGNLFVFTRKVIYKLDVPVTRTAWISGNAANRAAEPLQTVVQREGGTYGARCVTPVNGDLFYQAPNSIRSLMLAIRYFQQWGNTEISSNVDRVLRFNDRSMMRYASGIGFDNRLLQTALPVTTPVGVAFQALVPLDFDLVSSLGEKLPPAWEGHQEGLDILQVFTGDYGGLQRAFAVVYSRLDGSIQVWELTATDRFDDADKAAPLGDKRVTWWIETPAWTWAKEYEMKRLEGGEIYVDKLFGTTEIKVEYRVDANPCWQPWCETTICASRSSCEDVMNPICYPVSPYREGSRFPITLPRPPLPACETMNNRPMNIGYQFQVKITVKGWCRIRGLLVFASPVEKAVYSGLNCC